MNCGRTGCTSRRTPELALTRTSGASPGRRSNNSKSTNVSFLHSAVNIRRELAAAQPFRPVTFYAWHDEMAWQLRFSTACCAGGALPFRAKVMLVHDPREIVAAFVWSPYRNGIPWSELEVVPGDPSVAPALDDKPTLSVWSVTLV
jgi:hypothetical protein